MFWKVQSLYFFVCYFWGVRVKAVGPIFAINTIDTRMYPEIDILIDVADARSSRLSGVK